MSPARAPALQSPEFGLALGLYVFFTVFFWGTLYYHLRTGAPKTNFVRFWRLVVVSGWLFVPYLAWVAFAASLATSLGWFNLDFWWELDLLIDIMLLGHWQEMRAIGQARELQIIIFLTAGAGSDTTATPLHQGQSHLALERGWVVASETAALDIVGASYIREIEPGEMIAVDEHGLRTRRFAPAAPKGPMSSTTASAART